MPSHDQKPPEQASGHIEQMMRGAGFNQSNGMVLQELSALRGEIAELRKLLSQPSSIIITGRDVERIYTALAAKSEV